MRFGAESIPRNSVSVSLTDPQMIRRAGSFALPPDSEDDIPTPADDKDVLEVKWQAFIKRES